MKIGGFQKVTLLDYPDKVACTIFLWGCNFRCGFCHNPELVIKPFSGGYSEAEILDFLEKRKGKLDAVCFTGGEPLLSLEKDFVKKIRDMGYFIKIDTNGSFPDRLKAFIEDGLVDYIAMDLKSSRENYSKATGVSIDLDKIERSIKMIYDFGNYEFRTTIVKRYHDKDEIKKLGEWIVGVCGGKPKSYFLQGFLNSGELIDNSFYDEENVRESYLNDLKKVAENFFENVGVRV